MLRLYYVLFCLVRRIALLPVLLSSVNLPRLLTLIRRPEPRAFLCIPILLNFKLPIPILSLRLGPQFGTLLNKNDNLTTDGKNAFTAGDFSMVAGAQVNILKFKGGLRYEYGF